MRGLSRGLRPSCRRSGANLMAALLQVGELAQRNERESGVLSVVQAYLRKMNHFCGITAHSLRSAFLGDHEKPVLATESSKRFGKGTRSQPFNLQWQDSTGRGQIVFHQAHHTVGIEANGFTAILID